MPRRHVSMREMKHDRFREGVFAWTTRIREAAHRHARHIGIAGIVCAVALVVAALAFAFVQHTRRQTAESLAVAMEALTGDTGTPASPTAPAPVPETVRMKEALPKLEETAGEHPGTPAGRTALYYAGLLEMKLGQTAEARSSLEKFEKSAGGSPLRPLARAQLARIAEAEKRADDAETTWKELVKEDSPYLSADTAEMELARFYERQGRLAEARTTYGAVAGRTASAWSGAAGQKKQQLDEILGPEPPQSAPATAPAAAGS